MMPRWRGSDGDRLGDEGEEEEKEEGRQAGCRPGRFQRFPTWASESASISPQAGATGKPETKTKIGRTSGIGVGSGKFV